MMMAIPTLKFSVDRGLVMVGVLNNSMLLKDRFHRNGIVE